MLRSVPLPLLPGNTINRNIGLTKFHKSHHFETYDKIPILSEKLKPGIGGEPIFHTKSERQPSIYPRAEVPELPAWIAYDRQVLSFDAYFQETVEETKGYAYQIRKCKIYYYLEDGTIQIIEPKISNSGIPQGTLIRRQRIPYPPPRSDEFYDILDFNIGRQVEIYGRVFKITNCDTFTRVFLNRLGVSVSDPIATPIDPYTSERSKEDIHMPKKPNRTVDTRGPFLELDRKVLRFYGYWDDRDSEHGIIHKLELQYFLSDDTIAIKEDVPPNSGRDSGFLFCRRGKLPKKFLGLPPPGDADLTTLLNVLTSEGDNEGPSKNRSVVDALGSSGPPAEIFYRDCDLAIGAAIDCYGRKIVLTDCDAFTREYYRAKYGVGEIKPLEIPESEEDIAKRNAPPRELPPYNGYGSYEDSAGNCRTVMPTPPSRDFVKFLKKDRQGLDSYILRFKAQMLSKIPENCGRLFVISYYLCDDTISVFEMPQTGFNGGMFYKRDKMYKPGQDFFTNKEPDAYTMQDMYIGNILNIHEYIFRLTDADEYALRYMELNSHEFPRSNIHTVLSKVRESLKPVYKDFVCKFLVDKTEGEESTIISFDKLRDELRVVMGDNITEHEIITIGRNYMFQKNEEKYTKDKLRSIVHTQLKRFLFSALDRMLETFLHLDSERTGFLPKDKVYLTCRASCLPLDKYIIEAVIERLQHNCKGHVSYVELVNFLDTKKEQIPPSVPDDYKKDFSFMAFGMDNTVRKIDFNAFLKDLDLEKTIADQCS